jgi:ankyrin repeat protein
MKMYVLVSRRCHSPISRIAVIALIGLSWSGPLFCGVIHDAAQTGDLAKVKSLLKNNPNLVNSTDEMFGNTPLQVAAMYGHKDVAELLLANKAAVNARNKSGQTPLHWAAYGGYKDVADLLLANGADVNATDNIGATPLRVAVHEKHADVADLLRQHGGHE